MDFAFTYKELFEAYEDCIRHKKNSPNAIQFMVDKYERVIDLCDSINDRTYVISPSTAFIITFPKAREVFAADFVDRIVHHLLINEMYPYFEKYFIEECFSCMKGRGTLHGVQTMEKYMRQCSNEYTEPAYILKMDIRSFFLNIDKVLLRDRLIAFINAVYPDNRKKDTIKWLFDMIIMHHPEKDCIRRSPIWMWSILGEGKSVFDIVGEKGLPIGNLTSQMLANFYMTPFDLFVKGTLGFEFYGRYVDDFILIDRDKERLKEAIPLMRQFCKDNLLIELHPHKIYLQDVKHGVKFIGADIMPNRMYCGNRTIGNMQTKLMTKYKTFDEAMLDNFVSSMNSYLGYMKHYSTYNMRNAILTDEELMGEWLNHVKISKDMLRISKIEG